MIKWLCEIEVTDEESNNFYHFNDNRVLPVGVDVERANREGWWFKPEYIINELNINATIAYPAHGETISAAKPSYKLQGYAYSGGGRKVTRVEISLRAWDEAQNCMPDAPTWNVMGMMNNPWYR